MKYLYGLVFIPFFALSPALAAPQSSSSNSQASNTNSAAQDSSSTKQDPAAKTATKPKKVWTNDEISSAGGAGAISVVGNENPKGAKTGRVDRSTTENGTSSTQERQIATYRDRLRQLRAQMDAADKKISDLRNFKAENTSPAGGINMKQGYSMTPVEDQVKQLEEKKKQLQAQIDDLEDRARKNGIEPGQLR
jgi:hypothetical protein